ncbi:MAG: hypothetical protein BWX97_00821 [Firmicutes bacterium ADurb.Bin146]|nr:MAG: hypothetical protein BWX97_00821 [Firmicutes bacterium ADurb.Bin146]
MATGRSFAEFVKIKCFDGLYEAAEKYVSEDSDSLDLRTRNVRSIGEVEFVDASIQRVYVRDLPGMRVAFDVGLELELCVHDGNHRTDEYDECNPWIRISCEGDLSKGLDDWSIKDVEPYNPRTTPPLNSMSDALVPDIPKERLEIVATEFLKEYYPEALRITPHGQTPVSIDPTVLAERLGLTILNKRIREDASVFGQLYFVDTEAELFDANAGENVPCHINAKTIVVDPMNFLLRNLGSVNNTIVHECVHWVKHRKVFELEKLFNADASCISCEVVGGAAAKVAKQATEHMERQANQLTPRIQMPAAPFKAKAQEYITKFMREMNARHENEVMERVITALETDFCVSKQAAKIRLVELGIDEAVGTYTYLDNHYVKPHKFRRGSLAINQTFSLSAQDAAVERFVNPELRKLTESGDYLFLDNHFVYNAPLYVEADEYGRLDLTDYARSHMDECCLVFDLKVTSRVGTDYHTACYLNREPSDITFEVKFHNGYQNAPQERQVALRKRQLEEWMEIRGKMTDDQKQCMQLLLDWRGMKCTELADAIDVDERTIRRIKDGDNAPKFTTAIRICFALKLPPMLSEKLLDVFGCKLMPMNQDHQWIKEALVLKYPESYDAAAEWLRMFGVEI